MPAPARPWRRPVRARLFPGLTLGALLLPGSACRPAEVRIQHAPLGASESGGSDPDPDGTTPAGPPPLVGFWGLNGYVSPEGFQDVQQRFGITGFQVAYSDPAGTVQTLLPMVRAAGWRVTLRLTEDHHAYTTAEGDFDLAAWKAQLSQWRGSGIQEFVDDGTLAGHMLLDDITNFEGHDPDAAELDEMARYSQELMPGLMTFVRQKATGMPVPAGGTYRWVDAAVNQYEAMEGDVSRYARQQEVRARALGLGVINGLNIADGGDGSAGRPGYREGHYPMTAAEIATYGGVLARVPSCGIFLSWEYDGQDRWSDGTNGAEYFDQPELQAALAALSALFVTQVPVPLPRAEESR